MMMVWNIRGPFKTPFFHPGPFDLISQGFQLSQLMTRLVTAETKGKKMERKMYNIHQQKE